MNETETELFGLKGKTAIVWGGGAGIGAATSRLLSQLGASVSIVGRNMAAGTALAEDLREAGGNAIALSCDVRDDVAVCAAVDRTIEQLGLPTLSACIVGVAGWSELLEMSPQMWDDQFALNLKPMFLIGKKMASVLRDAGKPGSLVFVGSIAGEHGAARHSAYGASKAAMISLTKSMALEWGGLGIRVNCVAPGPVSTPRIVPTPEMTATFAEKLPAGRMGTTREIAGAIAFALSDLAPFMTGETLRIDGGWMAAALIAPDSNFRKPL